ncbi:MAG: tetratricopeptide repeat protein [Isosphaeraceae bacterium]|nr:tetratricopeptide repeat protein [Isosphaeraceae bacterium]
MFRRLGLLLAVGGLFSVTGCDYSNRNAPLPPPSIRSGPLPTSPIARTGGASATPTTSSVSQSPESSEDKTRREEILKNVVTLVQTAATNPGGANFDIAIKNLNHYFERGTTPADFRMTPAARAFLARQLPKDFIDDLEKPTFTIRDARHFEDCMLYNAIATRVAGEGADLERVKRLFEWTIRQVTLVPPGQLAPSGLDQAQARPYDCLLRGMGTELGGYWTERGWVFMSLCRQIGIDVGIVAFSKPRASLLMTKKSEESEAPVFWIQAALVDKKLYLFDARLGIAIPTADGKSIATLDDVLADASILDRLDLPGQAAYDVKTRDLRLSPTKIGILIDAASGYLTPRSRLLQARLTGQDRTILFRDPAEQGAKFVEALGPNAGQISCWTLPLEIEQRLFRDPQFVAATEASLVLFRGTLPLLGARLAELRGELPEAISEFVRFRFAKNGVMKDGRTPIVPEVQQALDIYATYFLGQSQLDQGNVDSAKLMFKQTLNMLPEPGPGQPFYYMFRWGALTNLGRIAEQQGDYTAAIAYLSKAQPTPQTHGSLLQARALIWKDPLRPAAPPLPAPPASYPPQGVFALPGASASAAKP